MPKKKYALTNEEVLRIARNFYSLASVDGKRAELTMYGEIVEAQPTDWWGDPIDGQFIILSDFLKDLEEIKGCTELVIHMNSVGGDAYASIAIHNRLRELANNGMDITCIVDGTAMSGGSLIMCAADTVKVNPSSIIMIHDCWTYVWKSADSSDLRKLADSLDVINEGQAEIYARKTGKTVEEIRQLMTATTYMLGRKAVELGFADEVIEDAEDPDISVSADRHTLYVCGRKMRIAAMGQLPEGIKTHIDTVESDDETATEGAEVVGADNNPPEEGETKGGHKTMTWEEFLAQNPEAAQEALAQARAEGAATERQRIEQIDTMTGVFSPEALAEAKYTNPCTAAEMAFREAQKMAQQGKTFLNQMQSDYQESGAAAVTSAPASEEEDVPVTSEARKAAGAAMAKKLRGEKSEEV